MRTVIYARISKSGQSVFSLEDQEQRCRAYANAQGWTVVDVYVENGVSAKSDRRPRFQQMLGELRSRQIQAVLVYDLDRLMRNLKLQLQCKDDLDALRVALVSIADNGIIDTSTPEGVLQFQLKGMLSQWFSGQLSRKVRTNLNRKASKGLWVGVPPYGYDRDAEGMLQPNADAAAVQLAASLYRTNLYTWAAVADELNSRGFRALSSDRSRVLFTETTLRAMFRSVAYRGLVKCKGETYPGLHEPLIDEETWQAIERIREQRSTWRGVRVQRDDALLSGAVWCGVCGNKVHVGRAAVGSPRYRCSHYRVCGQPHVRGDVAEPMLWSWLQGLVVPADVLRDVLTVARSIVEQEQSQGSQPAVDHLALLRRLERLKHLYLAGDITAMEYDLETGALKRQLAMTTSQSVLRFNEERARALLANIPQLLSGGTVPERRALVHALFDRVWLRDKHVVAVTPRTDVYSIVLTLNQARMGEQTSVSLPPAIRSTW